VVPPRHAFATRERLVFAHRGGARLAPENTLAAFTRGMQAGSDGVECDVHLSRDGVPVVIHDATLDRTTDARGPVSGRTADELARLDAGFHFTRDGRYPFRGCGIGVPRLADVFAAVPRGRIIVEMKQGAPQLVRAVIEEVRAAAAVDRVCVGSFYRQALEQLRREAPEMATSASEPEARWTLYRSWCRWPIARTRPYVAFQVPQKAGRLTVISPAFVAQAHRDEARVDVWVVDDPSDIIRLFTWGVDGVISDRPDVAVATRDSWCRR
jgi:glycerophosphoryl diester phosphodiesterase